MVYAIVCGMILGVFILKLHDELRVQERKQSNYKKMTIIEELYNDLVQMLYIEKKGKFIGILEPLNNLDILNNLVIVEDKESYTINKKIIHLCTKEPKTNKAYDKNTLMYVVLHELAHVICKEVGHTDQFSIINQALLDHAIKYKYYDSSKPFINNYCSL